MLQLQSSAPESVLLSSCWPVPGQLQVPQLLTDLLYHLSLQLFFRCTDAARTLLYLRILFSELSSLHSAILGFFIRFLHFSMNFWALLVALILSFCSGHSFSHFQLSFAVALIKAQVSSPHLQLNSRSHDFV